MKKIISAMAISALTLSVTNHNFTWAEDVTVTQDGENVVVKTGQDTVSVKQNGNNVTVKTKEGTTVVQDVDGRKMGQAAGNAARTASEFGLGVAEAFKGFNGQAAPEGAAVGKVHRNAVGNVAGSSGQTAEVAKGKLLSGVFTVNIAGNDGSASSYSKSSSVEIFEDGKVYVDEGDEISFSGSVSFTTASGEKLHKSGMINLEKE